MERADFQQDVRLRTMTNLLRFATETHGDRPFLREAGKPGFLTFREIADRSREAARGFARLGVQRGDFIPLMAPNGIDFVFAWLGLNLRGAAYVSVNTSLVGDLLANQLAIGRARLWVVHAEYLPALAALPASLRETVATLVVIGLPEGETVPGWPQAVPFGALFEASGPDPVEPEHFLDVTSVGFTSGTTGPSKGVMVPSSHALSSALNFARLVDLQAHDTIYTPLPMFHGMSTRMGVLPAMLTGCRIVLGKRFSGSRFWSEAIEAEATVGQIIFSIPAVLLAQPPGAQDRAHRITRMFNAHHNPAFSKRFGVELFEAFAMSEIGYVTFSAGAEKRPGSAGRAHPDWEVAVVDEDGVPVPAGSAGEIICRPRLPGLMMRGYLHQPDRMVEATRDLWFHTGDIARFDADGYLWFVDRVKERIRRRGENISSMEIEDAVRQHPEVADVAAVAHPAREGEDDIRLLVVAREGCSLGAPVLHAWMRERLPRFMVARYIECVPSLPYTATNKVEKARLMAAGLGTEAWDAEAEAGGKPK